MQSDRRQFFYFNSHTPCGVRHCLIFWGVFLILISTHTPHAGCDTNFTQIQNQIKISTHTPHAGCDLTALCKYGLRPNFNSHTPCGVRPAETEKNEKEKNFNSHTPCGVRPDTAISAPTVVSDFNSHTPCGVRPLDFVKK